MMKKKYFKPEAKTVVCFMESPFMAGSDTKRTVEDEPIGEGQPIPPVDAPVLYEFENTEE